MNRITKTETLHKGWTSMLRLTVEEGAARYTREIEHHGNAAAVLPYCVESRTAILVRLLRAPVLYCDGDGYSLEAPAGIVDGVETYEQAARREAMEEAGVRISVLDHVTTAWTSPGVSTERIGLFLGAFTAADRIGAGGGLVEEDEQIEVVELPLSELWAAAGRGVLGDLKTVMLVWALRQRHPELFANGAE